MIEYLFIGLFVAAINIIWKIYLRDVAKQPMPYPPSPLTFLVATVLWPIAILSMAYKAYTLGRA